MPLEKAIAQDSFARGMFRGVARHLIPDGGCYDLLNFLLDDEDGSPCKRGGSSYLGAATGDVEKGTAIWDGKTVAGDRTLIVDTAGDLWVASADDVSLIKVAVGVGELAKVTEHDGVLAITSDSTSALSLYGGSRVTGTYSTGTVTATNGSKVLTGAGGANWSGIEVGEMLNVNGRVNVVQSVDSSTQITMRYAYGGATAGGVAYSISAVLTASAAGMPVANVEFVAGRLVGVPAGFRNRLVFTGFTALGEPEWGVVASTDYHGFPGDILGVSALRDQALVFTTAGLFAVRNMAFDLTDAAGNVQQPVEKLDGLVLWGQQGVQAFGNALVVPARDGLYLVDGITRPVLLSASVSDLWRSYVQSGYRPGQAFVFRGTYCVPFFSLSGGSANTLIGWLCCRLDAGSDGFWPFTRLDSTFIGAGAVRHRQGADPKVIGASFGPDTSTRLVRVYWFEPGSASTDIGGTGFTYTLETRDFPTGSGQRNTGRKGRVRYSLVNASGTSALSFSYANEDGSFTTHADTAPEASEGAETFPFTKAGRFLRFRVSSSSAADSCSIRSLEAWVRPANRD